MERFSYEVYRPIDKESEDVGFEIRWAGEVWRGSDFVLDRYHKRFLLVYIHDGVCLYGDGDRFLNLIPGNLMFYKPFQRQYYKVGGDSKLHYYGISFSGKTIENIISNMPLARCGVHHVGVNNDIAKSISAMMKRMMIFPSSCNEIIWGEFMCVLGSVNLAINATDDSHCQYQSENNYQREHMKKVEQYIALNYASNLKLEELAQISGYSVPWFEKLFLKHYGTSPFAYQTKLRMEMAQDMLKANILSLSEISGAIGFNDPLYFSKVFKKHVGTCPKKYRAARVTIQ
ncbi:hypothetical protein FACS1894204_07440 [Synergistales bacterium]|nr:hypothetical protein FACS1894204_07440 [Synergistales bacterium]